MIYVITHKEVDLHLPEDYVLLGVGNTKISNEDIHDNTKDNISLKNKNFCELTGLYWIWKNVTDEIVGLTHYRRIFTGEDIESVDLLKFDEACNILEKYDIILPPLYNNESMSVYDHYCNAHNKCDIDLTGIALLKIYPKYYDAYKYVMNNKYEYGFNMFVTNKVICDEYSNWLFKILEYIESRLDLRMYDDYQKRVFGFLSERLFTVWIYYNKLKIKELFICNPLKNKEELYQKKKQKMMRPPINLY